MDIQSTLPKYPGHIVLPDYLNPEQVFAVEDAQFAAREYWKENTVKTERMIDDGNGNQVAAIEAGPRMSFIRLHSLYLPAIILCVKEWHLQGFSLNGKGVTYETFPMTPANDVSDLLQWVFEEIVKIYNGASEVPNE